MGPAHRYESVSERLLAGEKVRRSAEYQRCYRQGRRRHGALATVREIYRRWEKRSQLPPLDIVFHLKPTARNASFAELEAEVLRLCRALIPKDGGRA